PQASTQPSSPAFCGLAVIENSPWGGGLLEIPVSAYAGQEVDLEFVLGPRELLFFDIAGFTSVPEPSTWALFALGGLALGWTCRKRTG
ncbi:MAG TPA: PEP-CTERM sorting domain-containing protein, partial [Verrucomicrobiota bacterium]|nr:PEP-CTERM sorting domain-containing protein [Verrucomicrobiota bacterium]